MARFTPSLPVAVKAHDTIALTEDAPYMDVEAVLAPQPGTVILEVTTYDKGQSFTDYIELDEDEPIFLIHHDG